MTIGPLVAMASAFVVPTGVWFVYFRWKDKIKPEPWALLNSTYAAGLIAGVIAYFGYPLLPLLASDSSMPVCRVLWDGIERTPYPPMGSLRGRP